MMGLGMGLVISPTLISAQSSVDWERRGVVTGTNVFARSMGSALGIAVFGAIANSSLSQRVGGHISSTASGIPASVLEPALHKVFLAAGVVAVLLAAAVLIMPSSPIPGRCRARSRSIDACQRAMREQHSINGRRLLATLLDPWLPGRRLLLRSGGAGPLPPAHDTGDDRAANPSRHARRNVPSPNPDLPVVGEAIWTSADGLDITMRLAVHAVRRVAGRHGA